MSGYLRGMGTNMEVSHGLGFRVTNKLPTHNSPISPWCMLLVSPNGGRARFAVAFKTP